MNELAARDTPPRGVLNFLPNIGRSPYQNCTFSSQFSGGMSADADKNTRGGRGAKRDHGLSAARAGRAKNNKQ